MSASYYQQMAADGVIQAHQISALAKAHDGKPLAALAGNYQPILDRLEQGESAQDIASSYGISSTALYAYVLRHAPDAWQSIQSARQLSRLDMAERMVDGANTEDVRRDNVDCTRARTISALAQWHLERANRKLFGDSKDSPTLQVTVNMIDYSALQPDAVTITQAVDVPTDTE